jgi:hypothetical protein
MEAIHSSETSVHAKSIQRHIQEDDILQTVVKLSNLTTSPVKLQFKASSNADPGDETYRQTEGIMNREVHGINKSCHI